MVSTATLKWKILTYALSALRAQDKDLKIKLKIKCYFEKMNNDTYFYKTLVWSLLEDKRT